MAVIASPVMLLTDAVASSAPVGESVGKTPAASRRDVGLVVVGLLFFGFVAACVTLMIRAVKDSPDPEKVAGSVVPPKQAQQPVQPPPPQTAEAPQQQTGVPIIDQLHSEKLADINLVLEQVQNRYDVPGTAGVNLPKLEAIKAWTTASLPTPLEPDKQKQFDDIVDRFLEYRNGKLRGSDGQKALNDFYQLPLEAVPALVRGLNLAVMRDDQTGLVIAKKLRLLLDATEDRNALAYARDNLGAEGKKAVHPEVLASLKEYLDNRLETSKEQLKQNLPQLMAALNHADPNVRAAAANAVGSLGSEAKPAVGQLTQMLRDPDKNVRGKAARALAETGPEAVPSLVTALKDDEARPYAAAALAEVRPVPQDAVGALIDNLREPEPEQRAAVQTALISIGAPAVPPLIHSLRDKDRRNSAALTLGRIGKAAEPALPDLLEGLKDPDATFRISSHQALVHMGPSAVPKLAQALKDPSDRVWYSAVLALAKIGPAARSAVPALVEAMKAENKGLRILALNALIRIEPDHRAIGGRLEEIVPVLSESLKHDEAAIRSWSCVCLGRIGRGAKPAVAGLAALLKDKEIAIRVQAATALGQIGAEEKDVAAALISALADAPTPVRTAVTSALTRLGAAVAADLVAALKHKHDAVRSAAGDVLVRIGLPALTATVAALNDTDATARRLAAEVLRRLGPSARGAVPALLANLKDQDRQVRFATVAALRAIRPKTVDALQALWTALQDSSGAVADEVRQTLTLCELDKAAVQPLIDFLKSTDPDRRSLAVLILGNIGSEAKAALGPLTALLKDGDHLVRRNAASALGSIAAADPAVVATLVDALHDTDPGVCAAAQAALARSGDAAVSSLSKALNDKDAGVSILAAGVLAKLGPAASPAVPGLLSACRHQDPRARAQAVLTLREVEPSSASVLAALIECLKDSTDEVRTAAHVSLVRVGSKATPFLVLSLKHQDAAVRRGVLETIRNISMESADNQELLLSLAELVATLRDKDKLVRDEAGLAVAEIDPELRSAAPVLVDLLRQSSGKGESPLRGQADFRYVAQTDLVAAAAVEQGARLKSVLEELRKRRGDRVLAALAAATIHSDADVRQTARKLTEQYLTQKPKADDEQQAAARLKLYRRLEEGGRKGAAQQRYRELIRDLPHTRPAEEARKLLAGKS